MSPWTITARVSRASPTSGARLIDVEIVAEGVENETAAQVLRSLGCNSLQGYLFARSMPNGEFREWIHERIEPHVYLDA